MEQVFEVGKLRVTVEGPDLPECVEVKVDVDLRADDAGEEAARASIEALGGLGVFEDVSAAFGGTGILKLKGSDWRTLEASLWVPTGRERPLPEAPFLKELRDKQRDLAMNEADPSAPAPEAS